MRVTKHVWMFTLHCNDITRLFRESCDGGEGGGQVSRARVDVGGSSSRCRWCGGEFKGEAFGDACGAVSPSQPLSCAFPELGPAAGG